METSRKLMTLLSVLLALALVAASCSDDDEGADGGDTGGDTTTTAGGDDDTGGDDDGDTGGDDDTTTTTGGDDDTGGDTDLVSLGLWDDGPCDASLDPLVVGLQTVFESGVLTLIDQAQALEAAAEAFNARGGANGACIEVHTCDDQADPNQALECVRELDDAGIGATVNDTTSVAGADVSAAYAAAGIPRFAISPGQDDYGDTNSYPFDAGGTGTSIMMPQGLIDQGVESIYTVRVDLPAAAAIRDPLFVGIFGDEGVEFPGDSPVPAGTTDYSQFILAAEDAGAGGIAIPLGGQEAIQVLRAGEQLGSEILVSGSLGTFTYTDMVGLGDFASQVILNAANPPATFDDPVVQIIADDLAASGIEALQRENLKTSPMRSWIGLYALLYIVRDAGTDDFSRENLTTLIDAAQDIPMLGLTGDADWTPSFDHEGLFQRTGNNHYSFWAWDPEAEFNGNPGNFVLSSEANWDEVICDSPFGGPC